MKLSDFTCISREMSITGDGDVSVSGIEYDSRRVKPGDLFFCIRGLDSDGHMYTEQAVENGAAAVVADSCVPPLLVPVIKVPDAREALAAFSRLFFGDPSSRLELTGISGTNGKTTVTYLMESIYTEAGIPSGVVGTINYRYIKKTFASEHTTPESPVLNSFLSSILAKGAKAAFIEVSSHAISLLRVSGLRFATAIFTNLTPEHLDFHKTFEEYCNVKKSFFYSLGTSSNLVVNIDDSNGRDMVKNAKARVITYGMGSPAEVRPDALSVSRDGICFTAATPYGDFVVTSEMTGEHNVYNILAAIAASLVNGISKHSIAEGIRALRYVPGRLEKVLTNSRFDIFVDYAHTDDALQKLILSAIKLGPKRIITVFGCGGNRDKTKRPRMGEVAAKLSDYVILTSDNPRDEDSENIIGDILKGCEKADNRKCNVEVVLDRKKAIYRAVSLAGTGDIILIAGKGHESFQLEKGIKTPFSDSLVAKEASLELGALPQTS